MLELKNINKNYTVGKKEVQVLKNINLSLNDKQVVAIVGPSGSGKTTMMNIIGALDSDFAGDVLINGASMKNSSSKNRDEYRRNRIGFVFQQFQLLPMLSARQNIEVALTLSHVEKKERRKRADELLEAVGLLEHAKKAVNRLSGGQKQRVAIARALANNPDIILADEPTGALDSKTGIQIMEVLKSLSKKKLVIIITHSEELAETYADTIVKLADGKITSVQQKQESVEPTESVEKAIKSRNMSLFSSLGFAGRNLWLKKGRTLATAIGMSIGIIGIALAMALSLGTGQTFTNQINEIIPTSNISVQKDSDFTIKEIQALVEDNPNLIGYTVRPNFVFQSARAGLSGVDLASEDQAVITHIRGSSPSEVLSGDLYLGVKPTASYEIVLPLNTAQKLVGENGDLSGLLNQEFNVQYSKRNNRFSQGQEFVVPYTIVGITTSQTMEDAFYAISGNTEVIIQDYLDIPTEELQISDLTVYLREGVADPIKYVEELNASQSTYTYSGASAVLLENVHFILSQITNVLIALSSISVIVAILMIAIVISISVIEKRQEIGILRAIGARRKDIETIFIAEAMYIGVVAGIIGIALSYGISQIINTVANVFISSGLMIQSNVQVAQLPILYAISLLLLCVVLGVMAGFVPARSAAKLDPIEAMRKK